MALSEVGMHQRKVLPEGTVYLLVAFWLLIGATLVIAYSSPEAFAARR